MSDDVPQNGTLAHLIATTETTKKLVEVLAERQRDIGQSVGGLREDFRQVRDEVGDVRSEVRDLRKDMTQLAGRVTAVETTVDDSPTGGPASSWDRKLVLILTAAGTFVAAVAAVLVQIGALT